MLIEIVRSPESKAIYIDGEHRGSAATVHGCLDLVGLSHYPYVYGKPGCWFAKVQGYSAAASSPDDAIDLLLASRPGWRIDPKPSPESFLIVNVRDGAPGQG